MDATERQLDGNHSPSPHPDKSNSPLSSIEIPLRTRINTSGSQTRTITARLKVVRRTPPEDEELYASPQTLRKYRDLTRHVLQVSDMTGAERYSFTIQRLRGLVIEGDCLIGLLFEHVIGRGQSMGEVVVEWLARWIDPWEGVIGEGLDIGKLSAEVYGEMWARRMRGILASNHRRWGMVNLYAVGDVDEEGGVWIVEIGTGPFMGGEVLGVGEGGAGCLQRIERVVEFVSEGGDGKVIKEKL